MSIETGESDVSLLSGGSIADDEAAFAAGFAGESIAEAEPITEPEVIEPPAAEETPPAEPSEPAPVAGQEPDATGGAIQPPIETPRLFAGLTEDQLAAALARTSQLQTTVDKLSGRMGNVLQKIEALTQAPKNASEQRAFDLKLEKLEATFPELAEILREDLKSVGVPQQVEQAPAVPAFTQDDVNNIVQQQLQVFQQQQNSEMEVRALGAVHPDWESVIRTPQFALWRDNVIANGQELMQSESAAFISQKLSEFKQWQSGSVQVAPVQTTPAPVAPQPNKRLANALTPQGRVAPAVGPISEEDAFEAGFKKYNKGGY